MQFQREEGMYPLAGKWVQLHALIGQQDGIHSDQYDLLPVVACLPVLNVVTQSYV